MKQIILALFTITASFVSAQLNANFVGTPTSVCLGENVAFSSTSTAGSSPIATYTWDFGDGFTASTANTNHVYGAAGTYTVILTIQAQNGQADAEVKSAYITVKPKPNAAFTASTNGCTLPVGVTFTDGSSGENAWAWNFGNTQTSTLENPATVNYTTAGTYNVTLIITNSVGCKDTATQALVVSNFQAGITAPATACQNTPVTINDNSTVGANAWTWSFPGGAPASSGTQNNTVTFGAPGTYTISLTSQNTAVGCNASTTKSITILPSPTPSFTNTPNAGCAPQLVNFTNTSGPGSNFVWDFGDGSTFNGQNPPAHTYNGNGTFNVTLSMTGSNGCSASTTVAAVTLTSPVAGFTSDKFNGCDPLTVQFTDASTSAAPITNWLWIFGDGTTFNGQVPPPHIYTVGLYDVTLVVSTASGCIDSITMLDFIQVGRIDLVDFSINATPECAKTPIQFTDLSVISAPHDSTEVTYNWDFGDGGTSTLKDPIYPYPSDTGFFDVQLIVTFRGCKDTLLVTDAVYIKAPISIFSPAQTLYCNPASFPVNVIVNDNSKIGRLSDDALVTWTWGDGTPNTVMDDPAFDDADLSTTSHNYTAYGTYTIEQAIYNFTTGCKDSTTTTIYISQTIAGIAPLANDTACVGVSFSLQDASTSTHPFGSYSWDMGNGQTVAGANPSYAYPAFGTYTITLTATNGVGCADNATFAPFTALANPLAQISANPLTGCAILVVDFTNTSTLQNNGVPLDSFTFTFSDDNSVQTTTNVSTIVSHSFSATGVFPVTLVATDQFGCVSAPATVSITLTKPTAGFSVPAVTCDNTPFTAVNSSSGVAPLSYAWFVDGSTIPSAFSTDFPNTINEPNNNAVSSFTHTYTLIVQDANGCLDTITQPFAISKPVAIADYTFSGAQTNANGDFLCPPVFGAYSDSSLTLGPISSQTWNFGDGKSSSLPSPNNTYVFPGTYSLTYTIIDGFGCMADTTLVDYLTIFGPVANPSWTQDLTTCGQNITFDIGATTNVTGISWNLDDGTTVNDSTNFVYAYQDVATYMPVVTVMDANGCVVAYPLDTIVIPDNGINALFNISPSNTIQLGDLATFNNASTSQNPLVSWTWNLGTVPVFTNPNGNSVSNTYVAPGAITITLVVVDAVGCSDTYSQVLFVDGDFKVPNVITTDNNGTNDNFSFPYDIFASFNVTILNRWGNVIIDRKNQTGTIFWDGRTESGEFVNDGVYFYLLSGSLKDGTEIKKDGFVQVFRN